MLSEEAIRAQVCKASPSACVAGLVGPCGKQVKNCESCLRQLEQLPDRSSMLLSLRNGGKPVNNVRTKVTNATKNFQAKSFEVVEIEWMSDSGAGRV
eukprot:7348444-Karenia_brevis.AAC.1